MNNFKGFGLIPNNELIGEFSKLNKNKIHFVVWGDHSKPGGNYSDRDFFISDIVFLLTDSSLLIQS